MNLQDQVIYRCIHAACARPLPRRVNFCPFCGTGQHDGVVNPAHVARPAPPEYKEAQAPPPVPDPATSQPEVVAAVPAPVAPVAAPVPPTPAVPPVQPVAPVPPPRAQRAATVAAPPKREPVRLRWWLVALAALWLIWLYARPSTSKINSRIEAAMLASSECRMNDAQSELIALRMTKATPEQLTRLQTSINTAAVGCERKAQRIKSWDDTTAAVEGLLASGDYARAQARLSQFTRRWNEDGDTRKLKEKIASQKAAAAPPPEPFERVEPRGTQPATSARNLIDEAERALAAGDYQGASDKLETCMAMVDGGNRECAAFKVHADRLLRDKQRCLAIGRRWQEDRCF